MVARQGTGMARVGKKEEEKEESVLQGTPARWKNRNGSTKERGRRKWMEGKAREAGQDEKNVNLVSCLGQQQDAKDSQQAAGQADPKGNCRSC